MRGREIAAWIGAHKGSLLAGGLLVLAGLAAWSALGTGGKASDGSTCSPEGWKLGGPGCNPNEVHVSTGCMDYNTFKGMQGVPIIGSFVSITQRCS